MPAVLDFPNIKVWRFFANAWLIFLDIEKTEVQK